MISLPGFSVEREIGRGGMASVYLATQESLSRPVALKVLAPHLARDAAFAQRFVREGRVAASLRHRHIVPIFEVGVHDGIAYMALAWLPGGSLGSQALPLDEATAVRMLREIAAALGFAHRAGVVHRDVKPENILIDEDAAHVLSDFGIAQLTNGSQALTAEGTTVGTPAYMAPEQWRGGEIDGRADLYSLGIVFYQCLTGRVPYRGADGWSIGTQHMQAPLPLLPAAVARWQVLLDRLLAKLPEQRFADAQALLRAVDAVAAQPSVPIHGPEPAPATAAELFRTGEVAVPRRRWRPGWIVAGALAVVALSSAVYLRETPLRTLLGGNPPLATVLVLPCESFANVVAHRELGDALAEALIHRLSRLNDLTVIARASSLALRAASSDPQELGARSGATHVLACSIRRAPDGVHIGAELIETAHGTVRWSADFERSSEDPLAIVDELALGLSERLIDQLAGPERARLMRHRTSSLAAIAEVERARALLERGDADALDGARLALAEALRLDPAYAAAPVALAEAFAVEARLQGRDRTWWRQRAAPLATQALELDPDSADAYVLRSQLACAEFDWSGCRRDLQHALELAPGAATVQDQAAQFYLALGPQPLGVELARRWVRSAPDAARAWETLVRALINAGQAAAALQIADDADSRFPQSWPLAAVHALALEQLGRCDEAVATLDRASEFDGAPDAGTRTAASAYACAGQTARVQAQKRAQERLLAMGDPVDAMSLAVTALALDDTAAALDALESMLRTHDPRLVTWITQPQHGIVRLAGQPRLVAMLDALQLPAGALQWPARTPP